jgi:hypothetical protein
MVFLKNADVEVNGAFPSLSNLSVGGKTAETED